MLLRLFYVLCTITYLAYPLVTRLASYQALGGEGEERAWYQLRAHALNFPTFWGNLHSLRSLPCNSDVIIFVRYARSSASDRTYAIAR